MMECQDTWNVGIVPVILTLLTEYVIGKIFPAGVCGHYLSLLIFLRLCVAILDYMNIYQDATPELNLYRPGPDRTVKSFRLTQRLRVNDQYP